MQRVIWASLASLAIGALGIEAQAQVVPDATLGAESSRVRRAAVRGREADLIEGGAARGRNLFHSFQEFGVRGGDAAYFANPATIENIFSRVTGSNPSNILGLLGVDGAANLFLMNPNGILFGPNASLDVQGSFVGTTANAIQFGEQGSFSATDSITPGLLTVNPNAFFFSQVAGQGNIVSSGNLAATQDLTLSGNTLDLQGQLQAGGNLTLEARDTVRIRDSVTTPFVAVSGGEMLVQGDRAVDIFALNHPRSGLISSGNMILRSSGTVSGDAHFSSGASFLIGGLLNQSTNFTSFFDPVISSIGDVEIIGDYSGASLIIESLGDVQVRGNIRILEADRTLVSSASNSDVLLASQTPALIIRSARNRLALTSTVFPVAATDLIVQAGNSNVLPGITLEGDVTVTNGTVILDALAGDIRTQSIRTGLVNQSGNRGSILISGNGNITSRDLVSGATVNAPANISGNSGVVA
jgi:filamentous hemagglutinin family protein